ncbi:hypothetical protein [Cryobacterium sp. TMT3-29-2]|uniref:hypothetical protein n=1 Tax=Cryobacterium sp. TMT3-29-2 TaxID=2555867 RepID=UPI00143129C1|nr:hypothetical protein [Cryobacterium sp. TMT3-29-2]
MNAVEASEAVALANAQASRTVPFSDHRPSDSARRGFIAQREPGTGDPDFAIVTS